MPNTGEVVVIVVAVVLVEEEEEEEEENEEVVAVEMEMADETVFGVVMLVVEGLLSVILVTTELGTAVVTCKMRKK